jgi:hypothetical protein
VMGDVFFPDSMNDKVGHPTCHPHYTHHTLTHVWVPHSVAPCDLNYSPPTASARVCHAPACTLHGQFVICIRRSG